MAKPDEIQNPSRPLVFSESYTPSRWGRIFARETTGAAHPEVIAVLVPGMIISGRYMIPLARLLAPHFKVYIIDFPGFGLSDKPHDALGVHDMAEALADWSAKNNIAKAIWIANSFGCQVAVDLAANHPELVVSLVLQGPTVDPSARNFWIQWYRLRKNAHRESKSVGTISVKDYTAAGPLRVARTIRITLRDHIEEKLPLVAAPTLVVRGDLDPVVPQTWAEEVTRLLQHGELRVIEGGAHTLNYSEPEKFSTVIREYVERRVGGHLEH